MVKFICLTNSKDKSDIYVNINLIVSMKYVDRFRSTAINMQNSPSVWVEELPDAIGRMIDEKNNGP